VKKDPFVHLHLHTCYSILDGACQIDRLVAACAAEEMPAVAMTDHGVMYGAVEFYQAARKKGIRPILGCEVYITPGSRFDRGDQAKQHGTYHLVLLASTTAGYYNMSRLVSLAQIEGLYYKPRIDRDILAKHHEGLIGLSACLKGEVAGALADERLDDAVRSAGVYADILGKENFFLEVMDHGIPEQRKVNGLMQQVARRAGLQIVATNDVHYLKKEHARAHEVLLCLQTGTVLSDAKHMRYSSDEFYLKSHAEMHPLFREFPGAVERTLEIANRCNVEMEFDRLHFPTYDLPEGVSELEFISKIAAEGLRRHYGLEDTEQPKNDRERKIVERLRHEIAVIVGTGFLPYFLVVWDFMRYAREQGIPVGPGRGSGGGSLVAYALGITAIDPLHYDLIFERFLNPERVSPPDFDIDFCMDRRGEVIEYVKRKYGGDRVAQIITFGSLGAKTVVRDVGRVLEIPYAKCDRISKTIPDDPKITLETAMKDSPDFRKFYETDPDCKRILDYGFVLEGLYRNPGTHAAGVVIGERPLIDLVPLTVDKDHQPVTQYAKNAVEAIGLLKMDFLGLKTLTVLKEAVDRVRQTKGLRIDLENLPLDDRPTFALLSRGDTIGVFQLESTGMRDLIRRVSMNRIEDLIAMIALYRPGPMKMLGDYVDRKSGKTRIRYDHPLLEPILKETYGVMVYQEQVQRAANVLAGYSLGQADILRRAMGKKDEDIMRKQRASFVEGCARTNGIDEELAARIFDNIQKFAGYGFNKAHSAGYAIIAYQTAYMKANHPAEYMSALLSGEIGNADKIPVFMAEADKMGLKILPPDVNHAAVRFQPEDHGIRFGLAGIKNVGAGAAQAIVGERNQGSPFKSLVDFCSRVDGQQANKKVLESLVRAGAFDSLGMHRARLFAGIDFAMSRASAAQRDRASGQGSLFGLIESAPGAGDPDADLPDRAPWHDNELLAGERELLGAYMTGHPLTQYVWLIANYRTASLKEMAQTTDRTPLRVAGMLSKLSKRVTKESKESMAILTIEDLDGTAEVLVFPECYKNYAQVLEQDAAILVCGDVSRRDEPPKIVAQEIYRLVDAPRVFTTRLSIHIPTATLDDDRLARVRKIIESHPGLTPVVVCLMFPTGEKAFMTTASSMRVLPSQKFVEAIEHELGENTVYVAVKPNVYSKPHSNGRRGPNGGGARP
jgi:DNA polymerase-3 subunit alpha